ncbi:uncharacterized protein LOC122257673 [Penaeus japonicus]|uniref:uncharacterized protein LOC122257673 n=1 Tax=Penaeus japonicus TaxID=27405 RepID=UPI001C710C76|nr:uncharacterized protein LOC122257673 [Penaeus japonicus]
MKIQRRLPKSMRKNPCERAMPLWTSEPESTEWFDTFNLDGEELIAFEAEPQQLKKDRKKAEKKKKKQEDRKATKAEKKEERPKPTKDGYVVLDGNHHVIALGTPACYEVLFEEELKVHAKKEGSEQAKKRQQKAEENRAHHLKVVTEQMRESFVATTGELLIADLIVAGPGNMKASLIKGLPAPLARIASSTSTSQSGKAGLWELVQGLLAEEPRLDFKPKKHKRGMQPGSSQPQQGDKQQQDAKHQVAEEHQQAAKNQQADKQQKAGKHQRRGKRQ